MNTTIKWVAVHENFTTPICKSPLAESHAPYWMINEVALNDTTVNNRYGAVVTRLGSDSRGRHQVQLTLHSMIKIWNGSNISCAVRSELRMAYILYFVAGTLLCICTCGPPPPKKKPCMYVGGGGRGYTMKIIKIGVYY